jgi:hypothetical protein
MVVTRVRLGCAGAPPRAGDPREWSTKVISVVATANGPVGRVVVVGGGVVVVVLVASSSRRRPRSRRSSPSNPPGAMSRMPFGGDVVVVGAGPAVVAVVSPLLVPHAVSASEATATATNTVMAEDAFDVRGRRVSIIVGSLCRCGRRAGSTAW